MHLVIQLNEAARDIMRAVLPPAWQAKMKPADIVPDGEAEHHGLDPWVNWLSFALGRGADQHQCHAHGAGAQFVGQFLWDHVPASRRYGLIGAMNASVDLSCAPVDFFLGDPWTPEAPVKPDTLRPYRDGWCYLAKHYGKLSLLPALRALAGILSVLVTTQWGWRSFARWLTLVPYLGRVPMSALIFICYDWALVELFMQLCARQPIDKGVIFLNGIAHFQHSYWDHVAGHALIDKTYRQMMARLLAIPDLGRVDMLNGLEQRRSGQVYVWRQKDPEAFFRRFFPQLACRIEQGMTNDTTLIFDRTDDKLRFDAALDHYTVQHRPLFHIEDSTDNSTTVRVDITVAADGAWIMRAGQPVVLFEEWFYVYRIRTGEHVKKSFWLSTAEPPDSLPIAAVGRLLLSEDSAA